MTASISSNTVLPGLADAQGSSRAAASVSAQSASAPLDASSAGASEAVTLSPGAQATTQLLAAAHQADGVDTQAVATASNAISSGSYTVAPDQLAQAMMQAMKELSL